jgi:TonB family protein
VSREAAALRYPTMRRHDLRRLGPVVAVVVAAHALLLAVPRDPVAPQGMASPVQSVKVRMLEASPPEAPAVVAPASPAAPVAERADAQARAAPPAEPAVMPQPLQPPAAAPAVALPPAESLLGLSLPGIASEDDLYFPRSLLAVVPAPTDVVTIDYPVFAGDAGRYTAELSLFIDETGRVARVRVDSAGLPPALEDAARRAFTRVRFRPGEAAGQGVVKSRIRVEVTFENALRQPAPR